MSNPPSSKDAVPAVASCATTLRQSVGPKAVAGQVESRAAYKSPFDGGEFRRL